MRWWPTIGGKPYDNQEGAPAHVRLVPAAYLIWTRNQASRSKYLYYSRLYGGIEQATATPLGIDPAAQIFQPNEQPYNVLRSAVNTLTAKVAKNRPVPMYLPVGADPKVHEKVRNLNQFVTGLFHKHKIQHRAYIATRDACLYGTGQVLVQRDGRRLTVEQIYPWECFTDPVDARYGDPRTLILIRFIDKDILKYKHCRIKKDASEEEIQKAQDNEYAIETAPILDTAFYPIQDVFSVATRCSVIEAWHLPSGPGSKDGRHCVCLLDHTLLDEPWTRPEFPIARLVKDQPLAGFWGMGLGDELSGFQDEINGMYDRISQAHRIVGGQIWMVPDVSGTLDTDYNDEIGVVVRYSGGPNGLPTPTNPQPLHPATYEYFKDLPVTAYGFAGISTMSAQSQKPAGVTAALALQTLDDIETDRFSIFERAQEEFHVDIGRHMLCCVREIAEKYGDFEVMGANRSAWNKLSWVNDVDLEEDSYVVQAWPTSLLPKTPAAKLQRVMELAAQGIFDKNQVLKLMGLPDTDIEEQLMSSPREVADMQIMTMLSADDPMAEESYQAPGKYQDLSYTLSRAQFYYDKIASDATRNKKLTEPITIKRLNALARYMDQAKDQLDAAQAELMAQQAAAQIVASNNVMQGYGSEPPAGLAAMAQVPKSGANTLFGNVMSAQTQPAAPQTPIPPPGQ